jgi:hypothetical protein
MEPQGALDVWERNTFRNLRREAGMTDFGGWLFAVIDIAGALILGGAIAYGAHMWRTRSRNPAVERASDEATRRLYNRSAGQNDKTMPL